uniref:Uncharacterized protein n=1 Tax=Pristionchus pacificus TaxID=54126 RepID=A0A8R1U4Q9_PRIPA
MSSMLVALLAEAGGGAAAGAGVGIQPDVDPDTRIRARLRASRDGMAQLDALREKHEKLMEAMRCGFKLSPTPEVKRRDVEEIQTRPYERDINGNGEMKSRERCRYEDQGYCEPYQHAAESLLIPVDKLLSRQQAQSRNSSSVSPQTQSSPNRSDSPVCISHRSSVSIDSGCGVSITSATNTSDGGISPQGSTAPMPYATYRKISMEGSRGGLPPLPDLPKSWTPRAPSQEPARNHEAIRNPGPQSTRNQASINPNPPRTEDPERPIPVMRNRDKPIAERARMFEHRSQIEDGSLSYRPPRPPRGDSLRRASLHEELEAQMREKRDDSFRIVASTIESTTSMRAPSMRRLGRIERPRSMFEEREENRAGGGGGAFNPHEAYRNATLERSYTREPALVDSMSFSQITPPPVQRKFGVAQSAAPPQPKLITVSKPPTVNGTSSPRAALHTSPPLRKPRSSSSSSHVAPLRTPIKAEITPPRSVQHASAHMPISGVFTATRVTDASRTPPTKTRMPRPLSLHEVRIGITPDEEITGIFHARPVKVLSRQSSSSSSSLSSNSPPGSRKNGVVQPPRFMMMNQMRRSESSTAAICTSRGKLQKLWRESEGL